MDTHEGSRKRRRSGGTTDAEGKKSDSTVDSSTQADGSIVRDEMYYRENGDCVILVGRVLFKIHRFLLERDSSAFSNMFSMPQGDENAQANTDDNPLILYDDVCDFRGLCWIIYALPGVCLRQDKLATADLPNLVSLYLIAHKYHFESYEKFARDLLYKHCVDIEAHPSANTASYFMTCPQPRLQSLVRIANLEGSSPEFERSFSSVLRAIWLARLSKKEETTAFAFEIGEALGIRTFLSNLYLLHLKWMNPKRVEGSSAYTHDEDDLAQHRKLILYRGHWSLQSYWLESRKTAIAKRFTCCSYGAFGQPHVHGCQEVWKRLWEATTYGIPVFEPVHELNVLKDSILASPELVHGRRHVYTCATEAIDAMLSEIRNSYPDHFLGPLSK